MRSCDVAIYCFVTTVIINRIAIISEDDENSKRCKLSQQVVNYRLIVELTIMDGIHDYSYVKCKFSIQSTYDS